VNSFINTITTFLACQIILPLLIGDCDYNVPSPNPDVSYGVNRKERERDVPIETIVIIKHQIDRKIHVEEE
jgi:hypothetical protein